MNKCVFLDRDGVLNVERGDYTYRLEDFQIIDGVKEALIILKNAGFYLVIITNQGGIAKGIYSKDDYMKCHDYLMKETNEIIDDMFYSPYHPDFTESLSRKPDSLMLERAIAKYNIDTSKSWMIGDSDRDIEAANKLGVKGIRVNKPWEDNSRNMKDLKEASAYIIQTIKS